MKIEKGAVFYDFQNTKNHVVEIANDGEVELVIYKNWSRVVKDWRYHVIELRLLIMSIERNFYVLNQNPL